MHNNETLDHLLRLMFDAEDYLFPRHAGISTYQLEQALAAAKAHVRDLQAAAWATTDEKFGDED